VGAGVYLSQQEGGLDFVREFVGLGPSAPAKTVATKPAQKATDPASKPAARAEAKAKSAAPAIPDRLASGQILKSAFAVESADIDNGVLTLRQESGPAPTEVILFLRTQSWQVPAERSFQIPSAAAAASDTPTIRVRWRASGEKDFRQRDFAEQFTLKLELAKLQDRRLPGKISLVLPDEDKSQIAGTFSAELRGFRVVDGKPDLSIDSVDTLQYLALHEILKDDPDMRLQDVAFRQGRYVGAPGDGLPSGYIEVRYRVGDAAAEGRKFQFVKEQDRWRVARALQPDQLDTAHPREVPGPTSSPDRLFPYLAARRIETDVQKRYAGSMLVASDFATRYNDKKKIGVVEVGYKIADKAPVQTAFLFQQNKKGWTLVRELKKKERVNIASGKVETQR
ncbi:MAG TPA: hypothetical protein VI565_02510, partial [Burkholderiales bacterium]|nr:hypothetical protein [Burkholderiales bacterium]